MTDSQQALSSAQKETAAAQASLTNAESELQAARELAATDPRNPTGKAWLQKAQSDAHAAEARLAAAEKSEAVATREAQAVLRGRAEVAKLEAEISRLDKQITAELHPPGGFTKAQALVSCWNVLSLSLQSRRATRATSWEDRELMKALW